ncbi:MAG: hypothetical protein ACKVHO_04715, partial [Verrucomicrobiia bacterium]
MTKPGTFQVRLRAAETGFENKFAPIYEIRPRADLVPKVTVAEPRNEQVVAPEDRVNVVANATDDIGLARIVQQVRVNNGEWREIPLPLGNLTNVTIQRSWDLLTLGLGRGERLSTRIVAEDVKGSIVESPIIQLVVGNPGFATNRLQEIVQWENLREAMTRVRQAAQNLESPLAGDQLAKFGTAPELQRQQTVASITTGMAETEAQFDLVDAQMKHTLEVASAGREAADLTLLGRALSLARQETVAHAQAMASQLSLTALPDDAKNMAQASSQLRKELREIDSSFRELLAAKKTDATAEYFRRLSRRQDEMNNAANIAAAGDPQNLNRLARRESAALPLVAKGQEMLEDLIGESDSNFKARLQKAAGQLGEAREEVQRISRAEQVGPDIIPAAKQLGEEIRGAEKTTQYLAGKHRDRVDRARRAMEKMSLGPADSIQKLATELKRAASRNDDLQRAQALSSTAAQLRDRAGLEEARSDGDPMLPNELTMAAEVLERLGEDANDVRSPDEPQNLAVAKQALIQIEAASRIHQLEQSLRALAREEQWEAQDAGLVMDRTTDWKWNSREMLSTQTQARRAGLLPAVNSALAAMSGNPDKVQVSREMLDRKNGQEAQPVGRQINQLGDRAADAKFAAERTREVARTRLASLRPSLAESLQQLGARAMEQERPPGEQARNKDPSPAQIREVRAQQESMNAALDRAQDSMRRQANAENLVTPASRERARDLDDSLAMTSQPAAEAMAALDRAMAGEGATQQKDLERAAAENRKLAEALALSSRHQRAMESGNPVESRAELRAQEEALGIRQTMEERYAAAEQMQELVQQDSGQLREALRERVRNDPELRNELARATQHSLHRAQESMLAAERAQAQAEAELSRGDDAQAGQERVVAQLAQLREQSRALASKVGEMARTSSDAEAGENLTKGAETMGQVGVAPEAAPSGAEETAQAGQEMAAQLSQAAGQLESAGASGRAAAEQATRMAERANQLAASAGELGTRTPEQAAASAAGPEQQAGRELKNSADNLRAAAQQADLLGAESSELNNAAERAQQLAREELVQASEALEKPEQFAAARNAVNEAQAAVQAEADQMRQSIEQFRSEAAGQLSGQEGTQPGQSTQPG